MTLIFSVLALAITIIVNIATSTWVCFRVPVDPDNPFSALGTVTGVVLLNAMIPFALGAFIGRYFM